MKKTLLIIVSFLLLCFGVCQAAVVSLHETTADLGGAFGDDFKLTMFANWASQNDMNAELYGFLGTGTDGTYGLSLMNNTTTFTPQSGYNAGFSVIGNFPYAYLSGANALLLTTANTASLTNKTLDANGTGNVVKGYGYITFTKPHNRGTATGAVGSTETTQLYGVPSFADDVETNNFVDYIAIVPPDWDSSVDPTATFKFRLGGADTADHDYIVSMIDIADSAAAAGTPGDAINLAYTADGSGADGDIETASGTLTGWGAAATAGSYWLIRVTRDGDDGTNDASTVDSYPMSLTIRYGFTQ